MEIPHKIIIPAAIRGRYTADGSVTQHLEPRPDMCTNTITTVEKDNVLIELPARNTEVRSNTKDETKYTNSYR